jgi:hypothetical protein
MQEDLGKERKTMTKESRQNYLPDFMKIAPMLECTMQLLANGLLKNFRRSRP